METIDVELSAPRGVETFYTVKTHRYVVVLALTEDGRIPLVRQFRPAVGELVLELPSGHIDEGEKPADTARRELLEETGCRAGELIPLGEMYVDSGRLQTRQEAFFAPCVTVVAAAASGEEELEVVFVSPPELRRFAGDGTFKVASHVGVLATAAFRSHLQF
ncbi:MAG: NUDIX hydrolase [Actinobacteria bacterium]|nr:NUDIX hydrolase [Actinomycetota bacterium]